VNEEPRDPTSSNEPLWAGGNEADAEPGSGQAAASSQSQAVTDELRRLAELRSEGILTDKEFAARKAQLLGISARRSRTPRSRRTKVIFAAIAAFVVLSGGATAAVVKIKHDNDVAAERKAAQEKREAAAERARKAREAREQAAADEAAAQRRLDNIQIRFRRSLVKDLRASITKDFKQRVIDTDGFIEGPILGTTCDPISGGAEELDETTGKFECLVANERLGGGQVSGYPVDATVNYTKGSYTWRMSG
jgi:hypothetical protein